jgi:hypothetical protein
MSSLDGEDVVERAVVGFRPQVRVGHDLHELRVDAHAVARLAHAALEHVGHVELLRDRRNVDVLALEAEREVRERDAQPRTLASTFSSSSLRPSAKYSFSWSWLMLANGRTAIDGVSSSVVSTIGLSGGNRRRTSGWASWNTGSGCARSLSLCVPSEMQRSGLRQGGLAALARDVRQQHLAAVRDRHEARDTVQRGPEVVATPRLDRRGVQRHAHVDARLLGPRLLLEASAARRVRLRRHRRRWGTPRRTSRRRS